MSNAAKGQTPTGSGDMESASDFDKSNFKKWWKVEVRL